MMTKVTLETFTEIRKENQEIEQRPGTCMFIIEVPAGGNRERLFFNRLEALGYKFNEERCVFEYFGK